MRLTNWPPSTRFSVTQRVIVGRRARRRRRGRCGARTAARPAARRRRCGRRMTSPAPPAARRDPGTTCLPSVRQPSNAPRDQVATAARARRRPRQSRVARDGWYIWRWNVAASPATSRSQRLLGADRQVAIRMVAVEQPQERPLGHRRRHLAQLQQPVDAQVAHALEIRVVEARPGRPSPPGAPAPSSAKRSSEVSPSSVASAPTSVSSCAPSRPSLSCSASASRSPQPSSSRSPVSAASPWRSGGSNAAPARISTSVLTSGTSRCSAVQTSTPLARRLPADLGKDERRLGAGSRKKRPVDRHQETAAGSDPGSARPARPRGTTLSTTRSGPSHRTDACCRSSAEACV